jgi:uncharacterized protein (TIGR03437 family)
MKASQLTVVAGIALLLACATPAALAQTTGYWQYVRTETHVAPLASAYTDSATGVEGNFTVLEVAYYYTTPDAHFGVTFTWAKPPAVLVPGATINWPMTATVTQNDGASNYNLLDHFIAEFYPYQTASNLATFIPYASIKVGEIDIGNISAVGAVASYNNASQTQPQTVPPSSMADPNGLMTWLAEIQGANTYYWSYVYQWTPGTPPTGGSTSITVNNSGFETLPANPAWISCAGTGGAGSGGAGCRDTLDGNVPGWTASNSTSIGLFQPGPNYFTLPLPAAEGQTTVQVNSGTLAQTLSTSLQASTVYTLQVDVGRRLDNLYPSPPPTAQLFAGSTLIASATGAQPPLGGWTTWTGTYQSSASDPLSGQPLKIVLGTTAAQGNFDNVQLTAAPAGGSSTCTYTLGATSASPAAAGGAASVTVTAGTGCTWTATASATWITVTSGASGSGNGTVNYSVAANTGTARTGTITIAGQTFTVNQAAGSGTPTAGTCAGTCSIGTSGQTMSASGGTGTITVTATSSWTAVAVDSWIQITAGSSGVGNGTVTFTVSANTGPPHVGTISVAGQTYSVFQNGTPSGTTAGCSYLIQSSTTQSVPAGGTNSGFIQVITAQNCAWTATTTAGATWITILSGQSATGNGAVAYTVPANTTGVARSGGIVIAGQMVVINQDGGAAPGTPAISAGGVVNTASYAPGGPPNGSLAQGSYFSIYGSTLGPTAGAQASTYPLPTSLGGVGVRVTQGSNGYDCYLVYAGAGQINAILPSAVPTGTAQVVVTYNGKSSAPATVTVASTSLGIFFQSENGKNVAIAQNVASATDYPLNLPSVPAKPGQIVILWGTGMGPITAPDNTTPPAGDMTQVPVQITVGGVTAQRLYAGRQPQTAGVDNVYFTVPSGTPLGCQIPVAVTAGGVPANVTLIAITADGSPCQ